MAPAGRHGSSKTAPCVVRLLSPSTGGRAQIAAAARRFCEAVERGEQAPDAMNVAHFGRVLAGSRAGAPAAGCGPIALTGY